MRIACSASAIVVTGEANETVVAEDVAQADTVRIVAAVTDGGEFGMGDQAGALAVLVADDQSDRAGSGHDGQRHLDAHVVTDLRSGRIRDLHRCPVHGVGVRRAGLCPNQRQNVPHAEMGRLPDH
ncbi:hypothetical protein QFZ64_005531 [Streptomyces sp. B3I8]|nr:hypothetical protein [Streptomyces sp. B3I8]